jgi:FkbM family methyltransferase
MSLRHRLRAARVYLKSWALFRESFHDPAKALRLPFSERITFHPLASAAPVEVPGEYWTMLPTVCRLLAQGALPAWSGGELQVRFRGFLFHAPPLDKSIGWTLKENFIDDVYGLGEADLAGKTVLDIGAFIGDSTVALAARGAFVHAFEPVPLIRAYLEKNVAANGLAERVRIHPVGLSDRTGRITMRLNVAGLAGATAKEQKKDAAYERNLVTQELQLVEAFDYLRSAGIDAAQVVKLDCEGCEYALFRDDALLKRFRPERVMMEYHEGGAPLCEALERHGYLVSWNHRGSVQGHIEAHLPQRRPER